MPVEGNFCLAFYVSAVALGVDFVGALLNKGRGWPYVSVGAVPLSKLSPHESGRGRVLLLNVFVIH